MAIVRAGRGRHPVSSHTCTGLPMIKNALRVIAPTFGYSKPSTHEIAFELSATEYTPDIAVLEEYALQLIFVVDELKEDHVKNYLLGASQNMWPGYSVKEFQFFDRGVVFDSPIPMKAGPSSIIKGWPPAAKIKGEIHAVRPQTFLPLDQYKQNGVQYLRERIQVAVPFRMVKWLKDHTKDVDFGEMEVFSRSHYNGSSIKTTTEIVSLIRAWMYIGRPDYWDKVINGLEFKPVETFVARNRRWLPRYYCIRRPNPK